MSRRIRHHINPFCVREPNTEDDWLPKHIEKFDKIHVDMGCFKGEFIQKLAKENPKDFFIGVEIRDKIYDEHLISLNTKNLKYVQGNISISIPEMFKNHKMDVAYINFPDPYSKKEKLKKRRMINSEVLNLIYNNMNKNGLIYVQTDNQVLADEFIELFLESKFTRLHSDISYTSMSDFWVDSKTDWQMKVESLNKPVYQILYTKSS